MKFNLINKNISNSIWNLADIFLYPVLFFCTTSFFINRLGTAQYGIWMLINTIVISMQVFNFGIGSNVFKSIALHTGSSNHKGKMDAVNNALSITILLFIFCLLASLVLAYGVTFHRLLHVDRNFIKISATGIILAGIIVGFKFFEQVFASYFKGLEQFKIAAFITSGNKISALVINIVLLNFLKLNVLHLLLTIIALNGLFFGISFILLHKSLKPYQFRFDVKLPRAEARFALFTWLQSLIIIITFQSDRYMVVNYFGLSVLSYYALTATIFSHLHMGFNAIFPWLAPKLTKLYAQNMDGTDLYIAARNLVAICSSLILLLLFLLYPVVFRLILGAETAAAISEYVKYFIIFELFFVLDIVPTFYFNALGHEKKYLYFTIFFAIIALSGMSFFLWIYHKPISILYGLIVACIIGTYIEYVVVHKTISKRLNLIQPGLILLPALTIAIFILSKQPIIKWTALAMLIPSLYIIFIKDNTLKFKLLLRS